MLYKATITSFPTRHLAYNFAIGAKLINTDYARNVVLSGTDDCEIEYQLRSRFDRDTRFSMIISETLAQYVTGSNVSPNSLVIPLPVFPNEDITATSVAKYFNVKDIALCDPDSRSSAARTWVYVQEGADIKRYLVEYGVDQIMDIATTGTTTTTTTSTTSTTTTST